MGGLSRWAGGSIAQRGARLPLTIGPLIAAVGFALLAVPAVGGSYWTTFFPALAVMGLGMGVTVAPLTTAVMDAVDERHAGVASGINNASARIAAMLAVALLGTVTIGVFRAEIDTRLARLNVPSQARAAIHEQARKLTEVPLPSEVAPRTRQAMREAVTESFVTSFRVVALTAAGLALLSAAIARLTIEPPSPKR